jgi:hypothetical protein
MPAMWRITLAKRQCHEHSPILEEIIRENNEFRHMVCLTGLFIYGLFSEWSCSICALIQDILGFHCNFRFTDALLVLWSEKAVDGGVITLQSSYS